MEKRLIYVSAFNDIVSEDVVACVSEWDACSIVHVMASHDETARQIAQTQSVFAVLAWGSAESLETSGLPGMLAERGGRLVWVTDRPPEGEDTGWIGVTAPFTAETLRNALASLEPDRRHAEA